MNSGFGTGAPRDENYTPVRKGEKTPFSSRLRGVGSTGKELRLFCQVSFELRYLVKYCPYQHCQAKHCSP